MKLSEATSFIENHSRYFIDVYKQFNFTDDSDLRDYLEFILHEPVEWMRGFPGKWKSASLFTKPRAGFHKLLKHGDVITALGDEYATKVHDIIWRAFKDHTDEILATRARVAPSVLDQMMEETTSLSDSEEPPVPTKNPNTSQPFLFVNDSHSDDGDIYGENLDGYGDADSFHSLKKPRNTISAIGVAGPTAPTAPAAPTATNAATENSVLQRKYSVLLTSFKALVLPSPSPSPLHLLSHEPDTEIHRLRKALSILLDEFNRV